jgi:putative endonuclease
MHGGWVYILANRPGGVLYVGVINNLARRAWEHRTGAGASFVKRYGVTRLVYAEHHEEIVRAIQRETTIKHWSRAWKIDLIASVNPSWEDLYDRLN